MADGKIGVLEQLRVEREMGYKGGLYHSSQIEFAYHSNYMDGSTITKDETRFIYDTYDIVMEGKGAVNAGNIRDVVNHFRGFDYMLDIAGEELTGEIIREFHRLLGAGTGNAPESLFAIGEYRQLEDTMGGPEATAPEKVPEAIRRLLEAFNSAINEYPDAKEAARLADIIDLNVRLEKIRPFQEGNGRVGRLVMFKECLRSDVMPFVIEDRNKVLYHRGIGRYNSDRALLTRMILHEQDLFRERYERLAIPAGR